MIIKPYWIGLALLTLVKAENTGRWVEPNAWGRVEEQKDGRDFCPSCSCSDHETTGKSTDLSIHDRISYIYYKKLVTFLLDRKNYQYDAASGVFSRGFILSATGNQLELLESSTDPRDWDAVLSELLQNAKRPRNCQHNTFDFFSFLKPFPLHLSLSSEVQFLLLATAAILAIIYLHKRYNYGLIVITLSAFFIFGFIYTYLDCNRKLEIEEMGELLSGTDDPCAEEKKQSFIWRFFNFFGRDTLKSQCVEHLKKKHRIKLAYCRPDEVFLMYLNEVILNQFKLIVEKCTEIIKGTSEKMPFPYNIVAMLIFAFTLTTFLKLTFKYIISPKIWISGLGEKTSKQKSTKYSEESLSGDKISGDNLRLLLESFKHTVTVKNQEPLKTPIVSGVEEIEQVSCQKESEEVANTMGICSNCKSSSDETESNTHQSSSREKIE